MGVRNGDDGIGKLGLDWRVLVVSFRSMDFFLYVVGGRVFRGEVG